MDGSEAGQIPALHRLHDVGRVSDPATYNSLGGTDDHGPSIGALCLAPYLAPNSNEDF